MSSLLDKESERPGNDTLAALVGGRRRRILSILLDRQEPVEEADLAGRIVSAERETPTDDGPAEDVQGVRVELRHVHLPALADAGLVDWDEADATVTAAEHPALEEPAVARLIESDAEGWDEVVASLADERRRVALAVLAGRDGSMSRFALAREVAAREGAGDPSTRSIDEVLLSLHHVHLPKLQDARLVEYDPDGETVTYDGHPGLEPALLEERSDELPDGGSEWLVRCLG